MALEGTGFRLVIRRIATLRPHEETIPRNVQKITEEIRRDGIQRDPILVDGETGAVLDGMHRLAAFESLGLENAVCCAVDYSSLSVKLSRWARVYGSQEGSSLEEGARSAGLSRASDVARSLGLLDERAASCAGFLKGSAWISGGSESLSEGFEVVRRLDRTSEEAGWTRAFVPEEEMDVPMQDPRKLVVLVRRLSKEDVVGAARTGRLFPCKTSMHAIDPRPVAVDFPLASLNSATAETLRRWVGAHSSSVLPPNSTYEGRRYKESLLKLS